MPKRNALSGALTIRCPKPLFDWLRARAAATETTLGAVTVDCIARGANMLGHSFPTKPNPPHRPRNIIAPDGKSE